MADKYESPLPIVRRPITTEQILDGLNAALCLAEVDDGDPTDEEEAARLAANAWLRKMYAYLEYRKARRANPAAYARPFNK